MKNPTSINLIGSRSVALLLLLLLAVTVPPGARAIGILLPNQDPEAIARGNAFAATADNPSAIYYNPAGITQIQGFNFEVADINYLGINAHYEPASGPDQNTHFDVTTVPQIFSTYSLTNLPVSFGFGFYSPFGLGTQWPEDGSLRTLAIESRMTYLTLNPVVAWKILPSLSIAAGPTINYSRLKIRRGLFSPADEFTFDGEDWAYGFTAGILWQPCTKWSFGVSYRSQTTMDYSGSSDYRPAPSFSASSATIASVTLPQIVSGGISFRPSPKWNIEADVDYINWDSLNTVMLAGTKNIFGSVVGDLPLNLNWHDSWQAKFGVTRYFKNGWYVSAGYFYSSDTSSEEYFTPAVPDTELHTGSLGFGRKGEHWSWSLAAQIIAGPDRNISATANNVNPVTGASPAGKYSLVIPAVSLSVGYRF